MSRHPDIERVVQKEICQHWTDSSTNNRANLSVRWGLRIGRECLSPGFAGPLMVELSLVIEGFTSIDRESQQ